MTRLEQALIWYVNADGEPYTLRHFDVLQRAGVLEPYDHPDYDNEDIWRLDRTAVEAQRGTIDPAVLERVSAYFDSLPRWLNN